MSTNFYLYDSKAIESGVDTDRLVGIHVAKRNYGGQGVGPVFTIQAVVNHEWDRQWDYLRESPYWSPVHGFPAIKSWADWETLLKEDKSWTLLDEYDEPVPHDDFIKQVRESTPGAANERHLRWASENAGRATSGNAGHYLDDEGFSMCWWNFC